MNPTYPLARELDLAADRMTALHDRVFPSNDGHSVKADDFCARCGKRRDQHPHDGCSKFQEKLGPAPGTGFRNHGEEIAAALAADKADCGCPPGWMHQPGCVQVTGPRLRMLEPLDEETTA